MSDTAELTQSDATKRLNVEIPKSEYLAIKAFAAQSDRTVSDLVRQSIANTMQYDAWFRQRAQKSLDDYKSGINQPIPPAEWDKIKAEKLAQVAQAQRAA